jgi:hypothetical protein
MTQFEAVLYSIKDMDTDMLDTILDDEILYEKASKNVFLNKLNAVFDSFKAKGDTSIILEKGKCTCEKCQMENKEGYMLIGNISRDCLNLMFELNEKQRVSDIYCACASGTFDEYSERYFRPEKTDLKLSERERIDYYRDELFAFEPSDYYLNISASCKDAFEEINIGIEREIDIETINKWITDYKDLNKKVNFYEYAATNDFKNLYWKFTELISCIPLIGAAEDAIKEYKKIMSNEREIVKWHSKYEELEMQLSSFSHHLRNVKQHNDRLYVLENYTFYIFKQHFQRIIDLDKLFRAQYSPI